MMAALAVGQLASAKEPELVAVIGLRSDLQTTIGTGFLVGGAKQIIVTSKANTANCLVLIVGRKRVFHPVAVWGENSQVAAATIPTPEDWEPTETKMAIEELKENTKIQAIALPLVGEPRPIPGKLGEGDIGTFEEPLPKESPGAPAVTENGKIIGICGAQTWGTECPIITSDQLKNNNVWSRVDTKISTKEMKVLIEELAEALSKPAIKDPAERVKVAFAPLIAARENIPPWVAAEEGTRQELLVAYDALEKTQTEVKWPNVGSPTNDSFEETKTDVLRFIEAGKALEKAGKDYELAMWSALQKSYPANKATTQMGIVEGLTKPLQALGQEAVALGRMSADYLEKWGRNATTANDLTELKMEIATYGHLKVQGVEALEGPKP